MMMEHEEDAILNPKRRGLGRGLEALFEDEEGVYPQADPEGHTPGIQRRVLSVGELIPCPLQPRRTFDDAALQELAESISSHGVLQPLLVRPSPEDSGQYEIIAGERRWRASQKAQLHELPVVIRELTDSECLEIALIENLQRENLNPMEEARGFRRLMDEFQHTQEKMAATIGKSRSHIANTLRLNTLPDDVQTLVSDGKLSAGHARALVGTNDPSAFAQQIVSKGLNVRQTEKLVTGGKVKKPKAKKAKPEKNIDTLALEEEISNLLGLMVTIDVRGNAGAGKLSIEFENLDQLDDVLRRLSRHPA